MHKFVGVLDKYDPKHLHAPFPKLNELSLIHVLSIHVLSKIAEGQS